MRIRTFQISIRRPAGRTHRPVDRPTSTVSIFQIHPDDLLRIKTCRFFKNHIWLKNENSKGINRVLEFIEFLEFIEDVLFGYRQVCQ